MNDNLDKSINLDNVDAINHVVHAPATEGESLTKEPASTSENNDVEMFETKSEVYTGPGLEINPDEYTEEVRTNTVTSGMSKETADNVDAYLAMMDDQIEELKEHGDEMKTEVLKEHGIDEDDEDSDTSEDNEDDEDEFNEKYKEAVVVIDKTNFGTIINFTDEEREKLERSKKIKLTEVENVDLSTIKIKKLKKKTDLNKIINKVTNINTTNIVLPASGYTAEVRGCSAYELISLIEENKNALLNAQNKWSIIYNKLENTSIGKMSFDEFLQNTAAIDYNTFIYGLLCSTYPDDDKLPITCAKCKNEFEHQYSTRSLIRAEKMSDELKDTFMKIVDNSVDEQSAKKVHEDSRIYEVKRVLLPVSGIIAEVYVQSAFDLINKSIKELQENKDTKYDNTSVMSTFIRTFYIPDEDGSYYEVDNAIDISKTLYNLSEKDVLVIRNQSDKLMENISIEYGLMNIKCPKCGHYTSTLNIDLENILFYRYRQTLSTELE